MDFWEEAFRYYAVFGFIAALSVVMPVTTRRLQYLLDEVDIEPVGLTIKVTAEQIGDLEWVRSSTLISVKAK